MREELKKGSSEGIVLQGVTFGQKVLSFVVAMVVAGLLVIVPALMQVGPA